MLSTNRQLRAARALIGWEQIELAEKAGVSIGTIRRMEGLEGDLRANASTVRKVQAALEKGGVELLNHGRPGVRMADKPVKTR